MIAGFASVVERFLSLPRLHAPQRPRVGAARSLACVANGTVSYEISLTRYFYKPQPLRPLAEIRADILALEKETDGLLDEIMSTS